MKPIGTHNYFIYITTNKEKKVLYIGVTNDLRIRLNQHYEDSVTSKKHLAGKFNCYNLIYFERYQYINDAIDRETEIKDCRRSKKEDLIAELNPEWNFLNDEVD